MKQDEANTVLVSRGTGLMEAEVDDEMVGLHIENGTCYGFNSTAYRIWQLIERPQTLKKICAALTDEFDVDPQTCEESVRDVLADLAQDNIVVLSST